jgi:predicted DNA-binding protein
MMAMVRKQVYIRPRQEELLKRWAEEMGRTEAEIIREALDRWLTAEEQRRAPASPGEQSHR